ncbi:MAG: T9SS type A sorting domain-containing protein [Bacteroidota bacterium]|nr:T9SS type A sorting domain-containing protein [Bacteroidota bacterium]
MIADCGTNGVSDTVGPITFCTNRCDTSELCDWTMSMYDSFGDGWDGAQVSLLLNGQQGPTFTFANGDSSIVDFQICSGTQVTVLNSLAGSFPSEVSYTLSNASGTQTTSVTTGNFAVGTQATLVANCVPVSCPMPMNITLNNVTSYSAGLTWTGGSGSFIYDYREQGGTNMFNGTSTTPAASLTGLKQGTTYDFFVKEVCAPGDTSFTASTQFNTDSCFNIVIGSTLFNVDSVTGTNASVSFNWTGASYTGFNIAFGDGNSSSGSGNSENHTYNANGNYTVTLTLYSDCDTASTSFNVQINGIGLQHDGGIVALMIYPNPTQGLIVINGELSTDSEITIRIINYLGQEVLKDEFNPSSNVLNKTYDLSTNFAAGAYLIEIASDQGVVQKPIIIRY